MNQPIFQGCATAIVTPFSDCGVDFESLKQLIDRQIEAGVNALVVCGTTGEASTMSFDERMDTIKASIKHIDGRVPVIVGTGSNCTKTAVHQSKEAENAGADALLVVTPYYNKTTQRGLICHYSRIADEVNIPIILYNVPSRTGLSFTADTYAELAKHPRIIGVKEASGNFALIRKTRELCPDDFYIWSGNDEDTAAIMMLGGKGVISVVSNVAPKEMVQLTRHCMHGKFEEAGKEQLRLQTLCEALFMEVNPIPVKQAMSMMRLCSNHVRLPLCEMSDVNILKLEQVMRKHNLM